MTLKATTIRWDAVAHRLIEAEARDAGVGFSQFVREAALIRAALRAAERDDSLSRDFRNIAQEVERLASVHIRPGS
jgi:hypothetical protein